MKILLSILNIFTYAILNANIPLIKKLEDRKLMKWPYEFYYSALLSGKMSMVKLVEEKIPDIHQNHILDTSRSHKGKGYSSILLDETIYSIGGAKYFSHTMNYAIQSKNLDIVKYVHFLGYGVSRSNIVTAISTGMTNILSYVLDIYQNDSNLSYLLHYFGLTSFLNNKADNV